MTHLLQFDENLFHLVNAGCQNAFFDWLMPILRSKYTWGPLYVFIGSFLLINFQKQGGLLVLALCVTVALSDNLSSQLIKKSVQRLRPCKMMEPQRDMYLRVPCGSGFSFPSTHAANHFAMATLLILGVGGMFKGSKLALVLWATLIAFAQVYVGVHYPLDVLAGAMLGILVGWFVFWLSRLLNLSVKLS